MSIDSQSAPGTWDESQKILVILAHPDDPEFFCGATLARWAKAGHAIHYFLLTNGNKGGGSEVTPEQLVPLRQAEQLKAAALIGVESVNFWTGRWVSYPQLGFAP